MIRPIAYFCAEYGFNPNLPIYAGGLGILAGDYLKEINDQKFPIIGVGLFYDLENPVKLDPILKIDVPIQDRQVKAQVYKYEVGTVPVYLLSTNVEENNPKDRQITSKLYIADKETRLKQELILGIGGLRALEALAIHPIAYHLNEGHSAFLALELIRHEMQERKIGLEEAVAISRKRIIFTNHTLVAAGREIYSNDLVSLLLSGYAREVGIPVTDAVRLGLIQESSEFSMTMLSSRMSDSVNAVSKLHFKKASEIWTDHPPMTYVTNGIHIPTWDRTGENVVEEHQKQKELLLSALNWDPHTLTLGWARRFVEYKRPLAIFDYLDRFISIARNSDRPVKIIFSGEPHENDILGKKLLGILLDLIKTKIGDIAAYLPNYDMRIAKNLVAGCDVWLNTPVVGFEACGTSGMKAALNGTLPCSTRDGWIDEIDLYKIGWVLNNDHLAENILDVLEYDIVPMYYKNPEIWQKHMKNARSMIKNQFSTTRMLRDYQERLYKPLGISWT
jgi:glucan phosphorylase